MVVAAVMNSWQLVPLVLAVTGLAEEQIPRDGWGWCSRWGRISGRSWGMTATLNVWVFHKVHVRFSYELKDSICSFHFISHISHITPFSRRRVKMEKKGLTLMASSLAMLLYRKPSGTSGIGSFQSFKETQVLDSNPGMGPTQSLCAPFLWLIQNLRCKLASSFGCTIPRHWRRHSHVGGISLRGSFGRGSSGNHLSTIFWYFLCASFTDSQTFFRISPKKTYTIREKGESKTRQKPECFETDVFAGRILRMMNWINGTFGANTSPIEIILTGKGLDIS